MRAGHRSAAAVEPSMSRSRNTRDFTAACDSGR